MFRVGRLHECLLYMEQYQKKKEWFPTPFLLVTTKIKMDDCSIEIINMFLVFDDEEAQYQKKNKIPTLFP